MNRSVVRIFALSFTLALVSCENTTVEEDMDKYCDCRKRMINDEAEPSECQEIIEEISMKYEFDPEAYEQIKDEIRKCNEELHSQND